MSDRGFYQGLDPGGEDIDEELNSIEVGFIPHPSSSHQLQVSESDTRRRMSLSHDLNEQMTDFLASASMSNEKVDIKSELYTPEGESRPQCDVRDIESHHRSSDFPHIRFGVGGTPHSRKHHRHKHDHKKHQSPAESRKNAAPDRRVSIDGYTNEAADQVDGATSRSDPVAAKSDSSSRKPVPTIAVSEVSPRPEKHSKTISFFIEEEDEDDDEDDKSSSHKRSPDVGFYLGADTSSADLTSDSVGRNLSDLGRKRSISSSLEPRRRRGSEIHLAADHRTVTGLEAGTMRDIDDLTAHRFAPVKVVHHRELSKPNLLAAKRRPSSVPVKRKFDHSTHDMFVELDELYTGEDDFIWKERARWIKFEEDLEEGSNRWGKPHVASLSFHSLLELRRCLEQGVILLDLEATSLPAIANIVVEQFVSSNLLDPMKKGKVLKALLLKHKHVGEKGFHMKKNLSYLDLHLTDGSGRLWRHSVATTQMKKNSSVASHPGFIKLGAVDSEETMEAQKSNFLAEIEKLKEDKKILDEKTSPTAKPDPEKQEVEKQEEKSNKHVKIEIDLPKHHHDNGDAHPGKKSKFKDSPLGRRKSIAERLGEPSIFKRIPVGAEATSVLVGGLDYIDKPIMAFIRLSEGQLLGNVTEVPIPVRFMFILLGPSNASLDYYEIGRSISTLMADAAFHDIAYHAEERKDLMDAINEFLDYSIVLPPGNLDKETLLPIMEMARRKTEKQQKLKAVIQPAGEPGAPEDDDPLKRTKRLFGGLVRDVKNRYPQYLSDIKDGLNFQCLATFFFIYFACLSPAVTFGGLLGSTTDQYIGVSEMLVMVCIGGICMALLSGQPLVIVGSTGPLLVFEESLYQICGSIDLEYLPFRFWVGVWVTLIALFIVMFEGIFVIRYITRFLQELFSALISLIFIYEVFKKLYIVFRNHPLVEYYPAPVAAEMVNDTDWFYIINSTLFNATTTLDPNTTSPTVMPYDPTRNQPNTALLSLVLTFGTFLIAYFLKYFRNGKFLGRQFRRAIGDFGIPIAIIIMVLIDYLIQDTFTEKLSVPDGFTPTAEHKRDWLVNPLGTKKPLPVWAYFAAAIPAMLVSILMFMETLITSMIINKPDRNLKKGTGYHLDLLLIGVFATISGVLGAPLLCVATVRSMTHVSALAVYSRTHAPGEKPKLIEVKEQRVTGLLVHIMIGVSVLLGPVLRQVPLAVLFGVFLYMGVASMSGVQLFERIELLFMPVKHHPDVGYVRKVRTLKMHLYTFLQVLCLAVLWAVKSTQAALSFPFFLLLLIPVRLKLLTFIFTEQEFMQLDRDDSGEQQDEEDFYEVAMPI